MAISQITANSIADGTVVASDIADGTITDAKIVGVANTKITGVMTANQLANTAVTAGVYGGAANVSVITVDQQGRITAASNVAIGGFPAGTRMTFQQTSAPTGWTKDTTSAINDSMLRLVTGTTANGGTTAFSTWNNVTATGAHTLDTTQIPSHTHSVAGGYQTEGHSPILIGVGSGVNIMSINSGSTGGGGSHTHSLTRNLKYYDFIIASKD